MRRALAAFCLAALAAASAAAQDAALPAKPTGGASERGLQLALRTGFARPFGKIADDSTASISDAFTGFLPIWLEGGYRFNPNLFVGAFFQYALGLAKNCDPGFSCSGSDLRFGVEAHFHLLPSQKVDPWAGVGVGYEWLNIRESRGSLNIDGGARGFEFVSLQAGADMALTDKFSVGPFVALTLAQYGIVSASGGGPPISQNIQRTSLHELLLFGVRGAFNP